MLARFEELDFRPTPLGDLVLRRRTMTTLDNLEVYEILLGPEFLMSSLFTEVEEQLSHLGLQAASAEFRALARCCGLLRTSHRVASARARPTRQWAHR